MKVVQTYSSSECNEFDVIFDNEKIAYYIEHFMHPITNEILNKTMFEIYYDYNDEDDEFTSSLITDNFNDVQDVIDSLIYSSWIL